LEKAFTIGDVHRILNIPPRTLLNWVQWRLVEVASTKEDGRGTHCLFDRNGLVQFAVVQLMARLGVSLKGIRDIMTRYFQGREPRGSINVPWSKEITITVNLDLIATQVDQSTFRC
jgi:DNA-binding transcriptional MerR regulator